MGKHNLRRPWTCWVFHLYARYSHAHFNIHQYTSGERVYKRYTLVSFSYTTTRWRRMMQSWLIQYVLTINTHLNDLNKSIRLHSRAFGSSYSFVLSIHPISCQRQRKFRCKLNGLAVTCWLRMKKKKTKLNYNI